MPSAEITPQQLADALSAASSDARAVLANLASYASVNGDVSYALSSGITVTLPSLPKQIAQVATQMHTERLAYAQCFNSLPASETVTRDTNNRPTGVSTVLPNGWTIARTLTRANGSGKVTSVSCTITDGTGATLYSGTQTLHYNGAYYSGV